MRDTLAALLSSFSHWLIPPRCLRERNHKSFLSAAVRLHNTLQEIAGDPGKLCTLLYSALYFISPLYI